MVVAKVKMELVELVFDETKSPPMDLERFALHTEPKSPNTGLRYVRLMERLLDFHESLGEDAEPNPVSKQVVTAFIEKLVLEESGYRTPQAMMYALDFFGVVFGFQKGGAGWDRCVKMAGTYASKRPPRVGADFLKPEFLAYLEEVVIGGEKCAADRLVAGRLRLCCQASIRHSDLVRTRLTDVEWCRDKGRTTVRGLRARVRKTKTGPRPWVASFLGVSEKGDTWLPVLMGLLLEHHGTSWRVHEFFGPRTASHNTFLGEPTTLQGDVARLKVMMANDLKSEKVLPFDAGFVNRLRFHGCKDLYATLWSKIQGSASRRGLGEAAGFHARFISSGEPVDGSECPRELLGADPCWQDRDLSRGDPIERSCSRMLCESRNWGVSSQPNSGWR